MVPVLIPLIRLAAPQAFFIILIVRIRAFLALIVVALITLENNEIFALAHDEPFERRILNLEQASQKNLLAQVVDHI